MIEGTEFEIYNDLLLDRYLWSLSDDKFDDEIDEE